MNGAGVEHDPLVSQRHVVLAQVMLPGAYAGRLSPVCVTSASPRRIEAPRESAGIWESAGGRHVIGLNPLVSGEPDWDARSSGARQPAAWRAQIANVRTVR